MATTTEAKNIDFMELHLDPIIPMLRKCRDGRMRFNRGYRSPMKGKTLEELYGEERAREIIAKRSEKAKGHPNYCSGLVNAKPCVAIFEGRIVARFPSVKHASRALGISYTGVRRWLDGTFKPRNGWQWFYENESYKWCDLIRQ